MMNEVPQEVLLWSPPRDDEVSTTASLTMNFYDGATKEYELNLVEWISENIVGKFSGKHSDAFAGSGQVLIYGNNGRYVDHPISPYWEEPLGYFGTWITLVYTDGDDNIKEAPVLIVMCYINNQGYTIIEFENQIVDGVNLLLFSSESRTITGVKLWKDIPEWASPLEEVFSDSKNFAGTSLFHGCSYGEYELTAYSSSDHMVPSTTIDDEFSEDNTDRWARKPLGRVNSNRRNADGIWAIGGGFNNFKIELKKTADPEYKTALTPDKVIDGRASSKLSSTSSNYIYPNPTSPVDTSGTPLDYSMMGIRGNPKFYLAVSEHGNGSMGHYYTVDFNGDSSIKSYSERLNIDNLLFSNFDTSDTDNFAITTTPTYSPSGSISGNFIKTKGEYDIFLMPRRWAYYCRTMDREKLPESQFNDETNFDYTCTRPVGGSWTCDHPYATNCGNIYGSYDYVSYAPTEYTGINCGCLEGTTWSCKYYGYETDYCSNPGCVSHCGESTTVTETYHLRKSYSSSNEYAKQSYRVGVWWDRPPNNMNYPANGLLSASGKDWETIVNSVNLGVSPNVYKSASADEDCGDMSLSDAQGVNPDAYCGIRFYHLESFKSSYQRERYFFLTTGGSGGWPCIGKSYTAISANYGFISNAFVKIFGTVDQQAGVQYPTIGSSEFWNTYGPSSYSSGTGSEYALKDNIPYGFGISPDKAGTLVAIIRDKKGTDVYFIWRKTDEEIEFVARDGSGDYSGHPTSFESANNINYIQCQFDWMDYNAFRSYKAYGLYDNSPMGGMFTDQCTAEEFRLITKIGRTFEIISEPSGTKCEISYDRPGVSETASVDLAVPVYMIANGEYVFRTTAPYVGAWKKYNRYPSRGYT